VYNYDTIRAAATVVRQEGIAAAERKAAEAKANAPAPQEQIEPAQPPAASAGATTDVPDGYPYASYTFTLKFSNKWVHRFMELLGLRKRAVTSSESPKRPNVDQCQAHLYQSNKLCDE
jgi:hypothetical protein